MNKRINGRNYDTRTAKMLYFYESDIWGINAISETVYRKKNGECFLLCEGGANTRYNHQEAQNTWSDGAYICPLTEKMLAFWVTTRLNSRQLNFWRKSIETSTEFVNVDEFDRQNEVLNHYIVSNMK